MTTRNKTRPEYERSYENWFTDGWGYQPWDIVGAPSPRRPRPSIDGEGPEQWPSSSVRDQWVDRCRVCKPCSCGGEDETCHCKQDRCAELARELGNLAKRGLDIRDAKKQLLQCAGWGMVPGNPFDVANAGMPSFAGGRPPGGGGDFSRPLCTAGGGAVRGEMGGHGTWVECEWHYYDATDPNLDWSATSIRVRAKDVKAGKTICVPIVTCSRWMYEPRQHWPAEDPNLQTST